MSGPGVPTQNLPSTTPVSDEDNLTNRPLINTSLWFQLKQPAVIRSLMWGFAVTTGITAIGLYHCRGELLRALRHGTLWGCVSVPISHHKYQRKSAKN